MNPNDDNNLNPELHGWTDPELEARIVAWVAGEASPFEIAELERLMAEKPELAVFKRRIEAVHGLVADALRPDPAPQRLSEERKAKLLATLGAAGAQSAADAGVAVYSSSAAQRKQRNRQWWITGLAAAACLMLGLFVAVPEMKDRSFMKKSPARPDPSQTVLGPVSMPVAEATQSSPSSKEQQSKVNVIRAAAAKAGELTDVEQRQTKLQELEKKQRDARVAQESARRQRFDPALMHMPAASPAPSAPRPSFDAVSAMPPPARGSLQLALTDSKNLDAYKAVGGGKPDLAVPKLEMERPAPAISVSSTGGFVGQANIADAATLNLRSGAAFNSSNVNGNLPQQNANTFFQDNNVVQTANSFGTLNYVGQQQSGLQQNLVGPTLGSQVAVGGDLVASPAGGGAAQRQPRNADTDVVKLEAFEVSTSKDLDYAARALNNEKEKVSAANVSGGLVSSTVPSSAEFKFSSDGVGALAGATGPASSPVTVSGAAPAAIVRSQDGRTDRGDGGRRSAKAGAQTTSLTATATSHAGNKKQPASTARDTEPASRIHVPAAPATSEETDATKEPVSTFSLHVSDVSFRLAQAALARGEQPDPSRIRPEEFYNAFDYGDPAPSTQEKVSCRIEQSAHPFLQQRNLLRIALKVGATGRGAGTPLRLTVLLDTSGSMEREDRVESVRRAMSVLVSLLHAEDRITLIGFARTPRLLAEDVAGNEAARLVELVAKTPAEGGTNLEAALQLADEKAAAFWVQNAENRVVLLTDGAANLGNADPAQLAAKVESLRQRGIAFDACGVGLDGLDDEILEALTRKGAGRYYALNSPEDADAGFAQKLAGAFRPAAENVKLQVRFNPARVSHYRLIGFEQHRLNEADFRNDKVAAAELSAEEAAVALYQIEPLPQGEGELGEVFVRFRDAKTSEMVERSWPLSYEAHAPAFDRAPSSMQLAGVAALMAEKLRREPIANEFRLATFVPVMTALRTRYANDARIQDLNTMFGQLRRLTRE